VTRPAVLTLAALLALLPAIHGAIADDVQLSWEPARRGQEFGELPRWYRDQQLRGLQEDVDRLRREQFRRQTEDRLDELRDSLDPPDSDY
jgi:hypothetical protein